MKFTVRVEVDGLEGIANPEGQTVERALPVLGFAGVSNVHVGKVIHFVLEADDQATAERITNEICDRLLVNTVIERAEIDVVSATT